MSSRLNEIMKNDFARYSTNYNMKNFVSLFIKNKGFRYTYILRKCNFYFTNNKKIMFNIYRLILKRYQVKFGLEIPYETKIGDGIYIGHIGGIVVNGKSKIGKNVNILNGVLLGYEPRGKRKGCPTIGDKVWIGSHAVIVGNVAIGNNVVIAPNSFVNFDVPNNSVVFGNPAKVISNKNATESYVNNAIQ
ncbi:serine acetyltransferase [Bacillus salipaludis]|uniref:serine O-acetyltransferase n=1 Tax=Bacillus salipaludis TaxID=2547811 RepID=UPI002E243FFE|nr:serine acetyltransferase [Bacillus salipaludis]